MISQRQFTPENYFCKVLYQKAKICCKKAIKTPASAATAKRIAKIEQVSLTDGFFRIKTRTPSPADEASPAITEANDIEFFM